MKRLTFDIIIYSLIVTTIALLLAMFSGGCTSAPTADPKARTSETIGDARESTARTQAIAGKLHGSISEMTPDGLQVQKPVALEQSKSLQSELSNVALQLGVAAKTADRDEKSSAKKDERIEELESKSLSKSMLNWLAVGCFAAGVACILACIFLKRSALLVAAVTLLAAGAMFTFIAQYLDAIALAAGIGLLLAVAVGAWLLWKWLKDRNTGAKIIQSFQVAKAAGKLTISPDAVPILDAVQGADGKAFVDEVQKKGSQ